MTYEGDFRFNLAEPTNAYVAGITSRVKSVEVINPPITTVASGRCTSAPTVVAIAMGINPSEATSAVIRTGRNRCWAAFNAACLGPTDSEVSTCCMVETNTTPFNTATPNKAINPTPAVIERGMLLSHRAHRPPDIASGMLAKISNPGLTFPNEAYRSMNISKRTSGTKIKSRFLASCKFSN